MVVSDHYWKKYSCNPSQTWSVHLSGECSELICFWAMLSKFWPSSGQKMTENVGFQPLYEKNIHAIEFILGVYTYLVSFQNWFTFGPRWPNLGPLVATKWLKMVVSDRYMKKYSCNPIQTWSVHLLGECSELIRFWATLATFWPSSGQKWLKMVVSDYYRKKVFMQSNSNFVCILIGWVFRIDSLLGHVGQIVALWWPQNDWKWWFPAIIGEGIHAIQFKLDL